jgi:tyrosinase
MGVWDWFSTIHLQGASHREIGDPATAAHRGPAFLPWHRVQVRAYERSILAAGGPCAVYWDFTIDGDRGTSFAVGQQARIFGDDLFGPTGSSGSEELQTGRFALKNGFRLDNEGPALLRCVGCEGALPTSADVAAVLQIPTYDTKPFSRFSRDSFRNALEGWANFNAHNSVHVWIGGTMKTLASPNDPLFWLNHGHIDKIWSDWQAAGNGRSTSAAYIPQAGHVRGHNLVDALFPFAYKIQNTFDTRAMGYSYAPSPRSV